MPVPYHEALAHPPPSSPPSTTSNKWAPYSGAGDFSAKMVLTLLVLFFALLLALCLSGAVIRFLLCGRRRGPSDDPEKQARGGKEAPSPAEALPTLVFSAGTKLAGAGAGAECAICLVEFVEGDGVRVLPACNHGFHFRCIERWLASRTSCPTCRTSCFAAVAATGKSGGVGSA